MCFPQTCSLNPRQKPLCYETVCRLTDYNNKYNRLISIGQANIPHIPWFQPVKSEVLPLLYFLYG